MNFGQQRLIELLSGHHANVMVVGDDDQTIYEWRGARPNYILKDFESTFTGRPVRDYCLSRSFRFGPLIAHCAARLIASNSVRRTKPLVSHNSNQFSFLRVFDGWSDANHELVEQVLSLIRMDGVPPKEIVVLGRLYAQMDGLEAEFLAREIPYRVDGMVGDPLL